jgi:hypothetical protein
MEDRKKCEMNHFLNFHFILFINYNQKLMKLKTKNKVYGHIHNQGTTF